MATSCPIGFDAARLRAEVSEMYAAVARDPAGDFHFHRGPAYAARLLGYNLAELQALPAEATASFAGVGNPLAIAPLAPGAVVVDVGCGAGTDLLLAARRVGPTGAAIGVDMTEAMADTARAAAARAGLGNVEVRIGDAQALPVADGVADVVISNGVINLTTDKVEAFAEQYRALRPGGRLQLADIVVASELAESIRNDIDLWAS